MIAAIIILSLLAAGTTTTAIALAMSRVNIVTKRKDAEFALLTKTAEVEALETEYADYRARTNKRLVDLRTDIHQLESDLSEISTPDSVRIRLNSLLSKADRRNTSDSKIELHGEHQSDAITPVERPEPIWIKPVD